MKSCFFIGHREADERLFPRLELVIDRLIQEENVRYFYVGGYGGFDRIAATAVKRAKQKYPDVTLMLVLLTILLRELFQLYMGWTEHITRKGWRTYRGDTQLCALIKSWWIHVIGWSAMFVTVPAIPGICWSMRNDEPRKNRYRLRISVRVRMVVYEKESAFGNWNRYIATGVDSGYYPLYGDSKMPD